MLFRSGNSIHVATGVFVNGVTPIIIARKGDDFPDIALKKLEAFGITTDFMVPISGPTVRNWVIYEWDGSRTWLYRTDKSRSLEVSPEPSDISEEYLKEVKIAHIGAMPLSNAERLVKRLREMSPDLPISLDTHEDWIDGYEERLISVAKKVNYFIPSKEELLVLMKTEKLEVAMDKICNVGLNNIIVKAGADGAYLLESDGKKHVPAMASEVKDTTGAGDAFCGGFIAGVSLNLSLYESVVKGCETAGKAIRSSGSLRLLEKTN